MEIRGVREDSTPTRRSGRFLQRDSKSSGIFCILDALGKISQGNFEELGKILHPRGVREDFAKKFQEFGKILHPGGVGEDFLRKFEELGKIPHPRGVREDFTKRFHKFG